MESKILNVDEIARRMSDSFKSELNGFIFDRRLVDASIVSKIVALSGIDQYVQRFSSGDIIAYVIDQRKIETRCRLEDCRSAPREKQKPCIVECFYRRLKEVKEMLYRSIMEAASSIVR